MDSRAGGGGRTVRGRANPPGRTKPPPRPESRPESRQGGNGRPLRIILVDDHEMVLEGLKALLARFRGRVRIVAQSVSADAAEPMVAALDPDLVVSDVRLRGSVSGLDLCRRLVETTPGRRVVLLSAYDDEQYLFQALRAGAAGYLLKSIDREELVRMLERAARGETVVDPSMAGRAVASAARLQAGEFWPGAHLGLSQRESEVLGFLVTGLSNRAIAGKLVLGEETVKTHVRSIFRKLSVNDRAGAVAVALREGIFR
ncbi:response regulator transcription factor [Actinopolymorpha sp. NPDC004070]|uniref:response regulator transcription factor n=1 Tax=Actinopolymorpha sp. NPDC004070 TaxID=3154548 RepID=UPI0033BBD26F